MTPILDDDRHDDGPVQTSDELRMEQERWERFRDSFQSLRKDIDPSYPDGDE